MNINYQRSKLGDGRKTQHATLRRSSSYSICKNIRQRVNMEVEYSATSALVTPAKTICANVWSNSCRGTKVCGWDSGRTGLTV